MSVSLHQQRHRDAALRTDARCTENAKTVIFAEHQPNTAVNIAQRDSAAFFIAGDWAAMDKFLVKQHDLLLGHADSVVLYAQEQGIGTVFNGDIYNAMPDFAFQTVRQRFLRAAGE